MNYPDTAKFVRSARRKKGLSQERLAAQLGCSRLQVIRWEQGLHRPDPDNLGAKLAEALGVDPADLQSCDPAEEDEEAASMEIALLAAAIDRVVEAKLARRDREMATA